MKVFITGGTGLIGRNLIESLFQHYSDLELTVLTRNIRHAQTLFTYPIQWVNDLTLDCINEKDLVINLAGEPIADKRWSDTQKANICESRWKITAAITCLINQAKTPPKTFISASAIGIYGRQNAEMIDEDFKDYHQEFSHQICAKWESIALDVKNTTNTRIALLRTGIVLDKSQGALAKMLLPFKLGLGGKMASGEQYMSWIHIQDMVDAIVHIIKTPSISGAVNMVSPNAVTNKDFSQSLSKTLNRPCMFTTPKFMLKILFGEMAELFMYGQRVVPKKLMESGYVYKYASLPLALENLTYK